ncbi:flagellar motor switch protein FliN [Brucella sp. IR073]|uniref:flagellar motor switch protein FliN n=1 Tax=unclassified Brucella TaxID=2632610 RepID=UPI003B9875D9
MNDELDEAIEALKSDQPRSGRQTGAHHGASGKPNLDLIMGIPVDVQVVLGGTTMPVANLMKLGRGAVVTLDKQIGDPVDIVVNGRVIARGEVIVLEDDSSRFGVSLTEVIGK